MSDITLSGSGNTQGVKINATLKSYSEYTPNIVLNSSTANINASIREILRGYPGYSPTVEVSDIENGHRLTITDGNGAHVFDVINGKNAITSADVIEALGYVPLKESDISGSNVIYDGGGAYE